MGDVAVHDISFRGIAGLIFGSLAVALMILVVAFASPGWNLTWTSNAEFGDIKQQTGLWETCTCRDITGNTPDWWKATQAMITIGLILMLLCFLCVFIYMCVHTLSKNRTILALTVLCFITALVLLIGIIIWGVKKPDNLHWSFALTIISMLITLVAGVLSVVQMKKAGVST